MATWTNSQPAPRLVKAGASRSPVMRWPTVEAAELLDVDVDHLAGPRARSGAPARWVPVHDPVEAKPLEDAADGGWREIEFGGDLLAGAALPAKHLDLLDHRLRRRPVQSMRPRAAVVQAHQTFTPIAIDPLADGPRADACGLGDRLRRLSAQHLARNVLSTCGVRRAFLCTFIRSSPGKPEASTTSASPVRTGWTTY